MATMRGLRLVPSLLTPSLTARGGHQQFLNRSVAESVCQRTIRFRHSKVGTQTIAMPRDHGVYANYIPPENPPSITDFGRWRLTKWRNMKNHVQNMLSVGLIKYKSKYEKWDSRKFLEQATDVYVDMNTAFAKGDREFLKETCLDEMYTTLKNQIKSRSNDQRWEWKYHGMIEPPKIVCIRCMSSSGFSKHGFAIAQALVKMYTKQSMAVYDRKNRLVGGDPNKIHNVQEYVVFQHVISDPEDVWRVYGKIASPEKLQQQ